MTLTETLGLLLTLIGTAAAETPALRNAVPRPEVSAETAYTVLEVEGRSLALTFTLDAEGRIVFLELIGDRNPEEEIGQPTYRWVDAQETARVWSETAAAAPDARLVADRGQKWRVFFAAAGERPSVLMSFGPSFPQGPWTDETRGLKVTVTPFDEDDAAALE